MISSRACQGLRFFCYVHLGKNKLQVNCSIKTCFSVLFSRIHNRTTKGGGTRFFSHIQKDHRRLFSFVWVRRTSRFSFKRLFQCSNFHCQNIFLNFHLNLITSCTFRCQRERLWGKIYLRTKCITRDPCLLWGVILDTGAFLVFSFGLKHQLPVCTISPLPRDVQSFGHH